MNKRTKKLTVAFSVCLLIILTIYVVYSYTTWKRTITWTVPEVKEFTIWDSATGGTETLTDGTDILGDVSVETRTFDFYIQNEGNVEITVNVVQGAFSGCTPSWSAMSFAIPVGTTRILATLTLDITATGSYTWEFAVI